MTDLVRVTDHTAQALALLIDQYSGLPRLTGLVSAFVNRVQELENAEWDVTNKRLLDYTALDGTSAHAVAEQLDALGREVGQPRQGQDDATYLVYIRARIFLNKSRARRDDLVTLMGLIESAAIIYTEYRPATVEIEFTAPTATSPAVLFDLAKHAVTEGVRLLLVAQSQSAGFLFGDNTVGGTVDAVNGFSSEAVADGGYLAGIQ